MADEILAAPPRTAPALTCKDSKHHYNKKHPPIPKPCAFLGRSHRHEGKPVAAAPSAAVWPLAAYSGAQCGELAASGSTARLIHPSSAAQHAIPL